MNWDDYSDIEMQNKNWRHRPLFLCSFKRFDSKGDIFSNKFGLFCTVDLGFKNYYGDTAYGNHGN